ncbi:protein phosphatase PTC7 homolog [Zeugodacus cucurbitae]|uniref:Protein phosphatase n=3 Tax=Dacini TaxID=43871 RepID=A0A034VNW8_BACDO|nr:protein phosphatase PTC7 homolog [Zeugodacus cucurbitae]XP_011202862.1 protein phosphatase PTC7 homolog [Bactrocera dorsalis]XP_014087652.1 protein phosphatase PTC7 homolog isoform X1 [Bactrocera oleae]
MHSLSWTTRVISRALRSGFSTLLETASNATANVNSASKQRPHFVSVVCGFPKDFLTSKYKPGKYGEDSWFKTSTTNADVLGVADGVGGWRNYGIDPGEFSSFLMKTCERLVHCVNFNPQRPVNLLAYSYCELLEQKKPILGSSTACVLVLNRENSTVYTANIGDSGFMVVRQGEIIHKSEEQQHYFNTPFQLSLPPPGHGHNVLSDSPDSADTLSFSVKEGDVILVATDGVFDNVPERLLLDVLKECEGVTDPVKLQMTANSLALMARSLSFDSEFMSPFAINARRNNINATGGKPDDITVVLATVAM